MNIERHILVIAARECSLLLQSKKLHRENGTPEEYNFNLEKMKLRETTADFKIRVAKLSADFPQLRFCSLSLNVVNKYLRQNKKVCESSGNKYK